MNWTHGDFIIPIYRQRLLFIADGDLARGHRFLQRRLGHTITKDFLIYDTSVNAAAYRLERSGRTVFVIWIKDFTFVPDDIASLSHECVHTTINVLNYIGYTPRLVGAASEPVAYLQDAILRMCLKAVYGHQSKRQHQRATAQRARPHATHRHDRSHQAGRRRCRHAAPADRQPR